MINLQDPNIPAPTMAIEIDKAIYEMQILLETNLDWITHGYARAYRHIEKTNGKYYFPEVYIGGDKNNYHRVTPDNDKKGMFFFVVSEEKQTGYETGQYNFLKWDVGIIFWVNTELINKPLSENEIFTQNLIRDVREVLTRRSGVLPFGLRLTTVQREFNEVYKEFKIEEKEGYLRMPCQAFRFNLQLHLEEDCDNVTFNRVNAILQNLSPEEKREILKSLDFSIQENFDCLTPQQRTDLGI